MNGHMYIVYTREFIISRENVYKIGKSRDIKNRINGYPKGSIFLFTSYVDDIDLAEERLISILKIFTIQRLDLGREYFQGNYNLIRGFLLNVVDSVNDELSIRLITKDVKEDKSTKNQEILHSDSDSGSEVNYEEIRRQDELEKKEALRRSLPLNDNINRSLLSRNRF